MTFWELISPPWRITAYYAVALIITVFLAKSLSLLISQGRPGSRLAFLIAAPALSVDAWARVRPTTADDIRRLLRKAVIVFPAVVAVYLWFPKAISDPAIPWCLRAYAAIVPFWLLTEAIGLATQLVFLPSNLLVPDFHYGPWHSRNLAEFWGRRWNRPFADCFRQICFQLFRRRPGPAIGLAFALSAAWHEVLANLPLWLVYGTNRFGSMILYFLLQAGAILVARKYLRRFQLASRVFLWLIVLAPAPLVLNEATLRIFHLAH